MTQKTVTSSLNYRNISVKIVLITKRNFSTKKKIVVFKHQLTGLLLYTFVVVAVKSQQEKMKEGRYARSS